MKRILLLVVLVTGCGANPFSGDSSSDDNPKGNESPKSQQSKVIKSLSLAFKDSGSAGLAADAALVKGLYFGELEIVAYDYRPGETIQSNNGFGNGEDFSYWTMLQNGYDEARDRVLEVGKELISMPSQAKIRPISVSLMRNL